MPQYLVIAWPNDKTGDHDRACMNIKEEVIVNDSRIGILSPQWSLVIRKLQLLTLPSIVFVRFGVMG